MFGEKLTHAAKQGDEIAYLKIILDSLVRKESLLETGDVDLNTQFLQELKRSVDSTLRVDKRIKEKVSTNVHNSFYLLNEKYDKKVWVLP